MSICHFEGKEIWDAVTCIWGTITGVLHGSASVIAPTMPQAVMNKDFMFLKW